MSRYYKVSAAAAIATFVLIAAGGLVRATDSGLGCPDWPLCFGKWMPPADLHAWIEHAHRLIAAVFVAPLVAAVVFMTLFSRERRRDRPLLAAALLAGVLVVAQSLIGAAVVLQRLAAELVTLHLGMALTVLGSTIFIADRARNGSMRSRQSQSAATYVVAATVVLVFAQMLLGSWVTGHHAGLAYLDFPLMDGSLLPHMTVSAQVVQFAHRGLSVIVAGAIIWTALVVRRSTASRHARVLAVSLVALLCLQLVLGWLNVAWRLSALTVVPHLAVGAAMFASSLWLLLTLWRIAPSEQGSPTQDAVAEPERALTSSGAAGS